MTFKLDLSKNYCDYFKAYVKAKNLADGDEWKSHEYMAWITGKHTEFKKLQGMGRYMSYTPAQAKLFIKFINSTNA